MGFAGTRQTVSTVYGKLASRVAHFYLKKHGVVDQAYSRNVTWRECNNRFQKEEFDGGNLVMWPIDLETDSTEKSYDGYDVVPIQPLDTETIAQIDSKEYWQPIAFSFRERDKVRGGRAVGKHVKLETNKALKELMKALNSHMHLDGTGNSSKRIQGFALWVASDPTSSGASPAGVSQSGNSNWRNQTKDNNNSSADYLKDLRSLITAAQTAQGRPTFGLSNRNFRNTLEGKITDTFQHNPVITSAGSEKMGDPAIGRLYYRAIPIMEDEDWTQYGTATGTAQAVFLDPETWIIFNANMEASVRNMFEFIEPEKMPQQTANVGGLRAHIAVACIARRPNAVFFNGFSES